MDTQYMLYYAVSYIEYILSIKYYCYYISVIVPKNLIC